MMIFISHSGVAHDNNPPGRGSGRYPFGSGDRPFQHGGKSLDMDNMGEYKISKYKDPNAFDVKDFLKSLALTASYVGGYIGTMVTWNPVFMLPAVAITIPLAIRRDIKRKAFFW